MRLRGSVLAAFVAVFPMTAHAADSEAEALFNQGNALVSAGRYAEACPKLAESERLEPALGTRFNLADCYEHLGRTATAYTLFIDVARAAHAAGKFERERLAKERVAALAPRVPMLRLEVKAAAPDLEIRIDEALIPPAAWRTERALDPGPHKITATAPTRTPWQWAGSAPEGRMTVVTVPELVTPPPPKAKAETETETPAPAPPTSGSSRRNVALGVGGIGLAGLLVGAIAGAMALSSRSRAEDVCAEATYHFHCPTEAGANEWSSANTAGNIATVGFVLAGVGLAAATVIWLTAPRQTTTAALGTWTFP
jgi:hypothetical protein